MSEVGSAECTTDWLKLREDADAEARSVELAAMLGTQMRPGRVTLRDLGCGSGAMARWLAPRLPGPQHWTLHDRDLHLLAHAMSNLPLMAGDGTPVAARATVDDITTLVTTDLIGTRCVTASAVLDLLTWEEVSRLAATCSEAGCTALFSLSVDGRVRLDPAESLDAEFVVAFNAHQRRTVGGRRLLGPDAGPAMAEAFAELNSAVTVRSSTWYLGPGREALLEEWLRGWISAACEQRPVLARHARGYLERRLAAAAAGTLSGEVGHLDILAVPAREHEEP